MQGDYTTYSFPNNFFASFCGSGDLNSISIIDAKEKEQIQYLKRYLKDIQCKSMLVEHNYVDHDYLDDFAEYYVKYFTQYKRFCRRVHFWNKDITEINLEKIIIENDRDGIDNLKQSYLGFCVIKPLPMAVIGRTVLATYENDGNRRFYPAIKEYRLNLFGLGLSIQSLAFQEQDAALAACATTSLWSTFQKTAEIFQTYIPTPSDITNKATKYIQNSRPIPSHGLNVEQICYAISEIGLVAEVQQIRNDTPVNSLIYSYVQMGLPVVLGYIVNVNGVENRHAVTVCGYRLEDSALFDGEAKNEYSEINMIGRRISELYVHDDTLGPFSRLKAKRIDNSITSSIIFSRETPQLTLDCYPEVIIVPIYHKIRLTFNSIKGAVRELNKYFKILGIQLMDIAWNESAEWDIRLIELSQLKELILKDKIVEYDFKKEFLFSNRPKYNWVSTARAGNISLFSIISDATDFERSFCFDTILFHYPVIQSKLAEIIGRKDPQLEIASKINLPSTFVEFIRKHFLI